MASERPVALVTGCSAGGIGVALALYLQQQAGYQVFATARKLSNMPDELAAAGCRLLELDVTKTDSLEAAQDQVANATQGRLNLLINNVCPISRWLVVFLSVLCLTIYTAAGGPRWHTHPSSGHRPRCRP